MRSEVTTKPIKKFEKQIKYKIYVTWFIFYGLIYIKYSYEPKKIYSMYDIHESWKKKPDGVYCWTQVFLSSVSRTLVSSISGRYDDFTSYIIQISPLPFNIQIFFIGLHAEVDTPGHFIYQSSEKPTKGLEWSLFMIRRSFWISVFFNDN